MGLSESASALFSKIEPSEPLDVALLMRRTGAVLAAWTRDGIPQEVVSVMAATMLGSIATMSDALGCPEPERVAVDTEHSRILAAAVEGQTVLVLVAPRAASPEVLERAARRILDALSAGRRGARAIPHTPAGPGTPVSRYNV